MLGQYKPSWFYHMHYIAGVIGCAIIEYPFNMPYERVVNESKSATRGTVAYDIVRSKTTDSKPAKAILVIPGATGDSDGCYVKTVCEIASEKGFNVFIANPIAPVDSSGETSLEVIDYS